MAMAISQPRMRYTPDDVLRLEDEGLYELVDGQFVEKNVGAKSGNVTTTVVGHLFGYLQKSNAGRQYSEITFQCFPHAPDLIRRPDIAFIAANRLSESERRGGLEKRHALVPSAVT